MKNVIIIVLTIISVILAAILFANLDNIGANSAGVQGTNKNSTNGIIQRNYSGKVMAKANGNPIKEQEVKERLNFVMGKQAEKINIDELTDEQLEAVALEVAVQKKILEKAYDEGIHLNPELQNRLNDLVENIYKEKFLEDIAAEGVNEGEIKTIYEELVEKAKNSKQYKVKHILVKTEEEAEKLRKQLKKSKFEDLAIKNSLDKLSAQKGGNLGYIFPEEYVVEFSDTVKKLKNNEVSKPVKTQFGWHLIKLEDKRDAEILPLDKAKPRIEQQIGSKVVKEYIDKLSKEIKIEVVK